MRAIISYNECKFAKYVYALYLLPPISFRHDHRFWKLSGSEDEIVAWRGRELTRFIYLEQRLNGDLRGLLDQDLQKKKLTRTNVRLVCLYLAYISLQITLREILLSFSLVAIHLKNLRERKERKQEKRGEREWMSERSEMNSSSNGSRIKRSGRILPLVTTQGFLTGTARPGPINLLKKRYIVRKSDCSLKHTYEDNRERNKK